MPAKGAAQAVIDEATLVLPLAGIIDLAKERARLTKEIEKNASEVEKIDRKLGNAQFLDKAAGRGGRGAARAPGRGPGRDRAAARGPGPGRGLTGDTAGIAAG